MDTPTPHEDDGFYMVEHDEESWNNSSNDLSARQDTVPIEMQALDEHCDMIQDPVIPDAFEYSESQPLHDVGDPPEVAYVEPEEEPEHISSTNDTSTEEWSVLMNDLNAVLQRIIHKVRHDEKVHQFIHCAVQAIRSSIVQLMQIIVSISESLHEPSTTHPNDDEQVPLMHSESAADQDSLVINRGACTSERSTNEQVNIAQEVKERLRIQVQQIMNTMQPSHSSVSSSSHADKHTAESSNGTESFYQEFKTLVESRKKTAAQDEAQTIPPEWNDHLDALESMEFADRALNRKLLRKFNGDLNQTIDFYFTL